MRNFTTAITTIIILIANCLYAESNITSEIKLIDFENECSMVKEGVEFQQFVCSGIDDFKVLYTYVDLRESFGFFKNISDRSFQFRQTFFDVNYADEKVEWLRYQGTVFATLQTHYIGRVDETVSEGEESDYGEALVLSKISYQADELSCVVAYVDSQNNSDPRSMILSSSFELVSNFNCGEDEPMRIGRIGRKIPEFG